MAKNTLNRAQRDQVCTWLAADYTSALILHWLADLGWPTLSQATLSYYRKRYSAEIAQARAVRRDAALSTGLALKAERVARLIAHADALEAIKWKPDKRGRLWNEKAWRETLDDIASELGHRRQGLDIAVQAELEAALDRLQKELSPDDYQRVLAILSAGRAAT